MNGAVAYILNKKAAKICLQRAFPIRVAADGLLA